jgi:hypothetical protein
MMKKVLISLAAFLILNALYLHFGRSDVGSQGSLNISSISDNRSQYPGGNVPKYEKFEITFGIGGSVADNFQLPYDPNPPDKLNVSGISVDAEFLPPGVSDWGSAYTQPAFFYQEFLKESLANGNRDWFYPTGNFFWKVRYAPDTQGTWQYRLRAQDAGGSVISQPTAFTVVDSAKPGFVRVAQSDRRYFEFSNGSYFPALGYNMNFNHINWIYPIVQNQANFSAMGQNKVQLIRMWLSQWSIYGAGWNPWKSFTSQGGDPPLSLLSSNVSPYQNQDYELALKVGTVHPCVFHDPYNNAPIAVKRNTAYQIRINFYPDNLVGPGGFAAKLGSYTGCDSATAVTPYVREGATGAWQWLSGTFTTGINQDYLDHLFLHLENMTGGSVRVAEVEIRELANDNPTGPNILQKPKMDHHLYYDQRNSFAFDQVLDLAKTFGVYLRPVVGDHREWTFNHIDHSGNPTGDFSGSGFYFYGPSDATINKTRWLQRAWWRYLQARWGYSTNIHSWEYVNEGDPGYEGHRISANLMGGYFDQFTPNQMVSTSVWSGSTSTWNLTNYPGIDFADVHRYIGQDSVPDEYYDAAQATINMSQARGLPNTGGNWPVIRGETGFITSQSNTNSYSSELRNDTEGVWLHNFLWAQLNPNALIESYWYENYHIYDCPVAGSLQGCRMTFDHRHHYKPLVEFLSDIPLNRGDYEDAAAYGFDTTRVRVIGQKNKLRNRAHVWIQNKTHTWKNVVDQVSIVPFNGSVRLDGFSPNSQLKVEYINTYDGSTLQSGDVATDIAGTLEIPINDLTTDVAVKIGDYSVFASPTPSQVLIPGDANGDGTVDGIDYVIWLNNYDKNTSGGSSTGDFNGDGVTDGIDYVIWLNNYNA